MLPIICEEEEEEEDMTSNLRVRFCERQRKRLPESIIINPTLSKKACLKLASTSLPVPASPATIAAITLEPDEKLSFDDIAYHKMRRPFAIPENLSKELFKCMTSSPPRPKSAYVPNQEEISNLLRQIPSFTEREPLV